MTIDETTGEVLDGEIVTSHSRELMLNPATDSWLAVHQDARILAGDLAQTEFMPKNLRGRPAAALAVILKGREIGLPPMATMQALYSVDGRIGFYAEALRALILTGGYEYRIVEQSASRCIVEGRRRGGEEWARFAYTMQEARDAGLAGKDNWKKSPTDMLFARATGRMARAIFPDVTLGMPLAEEIADEAGRPAMTAGTGIGATVEDGPARVSRARKKPEEPPAGPPPERQRVAVKPKPAPETVDAEIVEERPRTVEPGTAAPRASGPTVGLIVAQFERLGVADRTERLMWTALLAGVPGLESSSSLTQPEAQAVLKTLERLRDNAALEAWGRDNEAGGSES